MSGNRDIRETGVTSGTHSAMAQALARRRREDEEVAQRRRAQQRLYEAQFRRPSISGPIDAVKSLKKTKKWLEMMFGRFGRDPLQKHPKIPRGDRGPALNDDPTPEQVFRGPEDRVLPVKTVMPPRSHVEIAPWILDSETLEAAYAIDDVESLVWSTDPYSNLWYSVGLILNDEEFLHVRIIDLIRITKFNCINYCCRIYPFYFLFSLCMVMTCCLIWSKMVLQSMSLLFVVLILTVLWRVLFNNIVEHDS